VRQKKLDALARKAWLTPKQFIVATQPKRVAWWRRLWWWLSRYQ
jgi:hypothetical protein